MAIERRGLEAAAKAVDAFVAHMGYKDGDLDPESILSDLVADILHLADGRLISGYWVWEKAGEHYGIEEGTDDEDGDSDDEDDFTVAEHSYGDEGQVVPDDPSLPVGAPKPTDQI